MQTKQRDMRLEIKTLSEDGTFSGLLSPYGNVDDGGDVVEAGAFTKSLAAYGNVVPMLWQHKQDCPIGDLTLTDQPDGLYCDGRFLLDIAEAQKAYALLKAGIIKGLSIGYETIKAQVVNGIRHLKELRLYEGSVVTFPMNPLATVSAVKTGDTKGDFVDELGDRKLCDAASQMLSALSDALYPLPYSGLSRDEMLATAETVLAQFTESYITYLPAYLDFLSQEYGMDTKEWKERRELKEGRKLSGATKNSLSDAHEHIKSAVDIITSLLGDPQSPDPTDDDPEDETKSGAILLLTSMRSLFASA